MARTQGAMEDFMSTAMEEPELGSIDFRQSLRFFQEQLILNGQANSLPFSEDNNKSEKHLYTVRKTAIYDEGSRSLNNCTISIPTVDTILESVRVLRAIQKSQEQRGSSWCLSTDVNYQHSCNTEPDPNGSFDTEETTSQPENKKQGDANSENSSLPNEDSNAESVNLNLFFCADQCEIRSKSITCVDDNIKDTEETQNSFDTYKDELTLTNDESPSFWPKNGSNPLRVEETLTNNDSEIFQNTREDAEINISNNSDTKEETQLMTNLPLGLPKSEELSNSDSKLELNCFTDPKLLETPSDSTEFTNYSLGEKLPNESSIIYANYPEISQIYRISWDSIDSNIVINSSLNDNICVTDAEILQTETDKDQIKQNIENHQEQSDAGVDNPRLASDNNIAHLDGSKNDYTKEDSHGTGTSQLIGNLQNETNKEGIFLLPEQLIHSDTSGDEIAAKNDNDYLVTQLIPQNYADITDTESCSTQIHHLEEEKNSFGTKDKPITYSTSKTLSENHKDSNGSQTTQTIDLSNLYSDLNKEKNSHTAVETFFGNETQSSLKMKCENTFNEKNISEASFATNVSQKLDHPSPIIDGNLLNCIKLTNTFNEAIKSETDHICNSTELSVGNGQNICKNDFHKNKESRKETLLLEKKYGEEEIQGIKKFTTTSWNLEAVVEALHTLPGSPESFKVLPVDETTQRAVFVKSQESFSHYSEGHYIITLGDSLQISQESESIPLLRISLRYGEVTVMDRETLKLDNKLGRCLYFKCETQDELLQLKEDLQKYCTRQWESECINLVHYPLKCHQNVVIIDLGSCSTRAGILMDESTLPFLFFPSVCATNKITHTHVFGKEALKTEVRQDSYLSFPVRPSLKIKDSINIELIGGLFKKIFYDLRVDPTEYTIQVSLPRNLSINTRNALVKLLLDDLNVQSVSLTHQALLTLYAHNVSTGIVVDIGERMDILPVVDGFIVENGVTRLPYGGERLIHHMKHALAEKHISLSNDIDAFVVQYITENLSYVAENYDAEIKIATQHPNIIRKSIELQAFANDDKCIRYAILEDARFKIPEGLFKPELWGLDNPGIHQLVQKAIQATSVDVRKRIAQHIYVSGGVTMIPGFVERLFKEVANLNKPRIIPKVIASNYRYHCSYVGACKFARMEVFPKVCINKAEYSKNKLTSLKKFALCF